MAAGVNSKEVNNTKSSEMFNDRFYRMITSPLYIGLRHSTWGARADIRNDKTPASPPPPPFKMGERGVPRETQPRLPILYPLMTLKRR